MAGSSFEDPAALAATAASFRAARERRLAAERQQRETEQEKGDAA